MLPKWCALTCCGDCCASGEYEDSSSTSEGIAERVEMAGESLPARACGTRVGEVEAMVVEPRSAMGDNKTPSK